MNIAIIGCGYVGLVTGACLADLGHTVTCIDIDAEKIDELTRGRMPVFEPGLADLVASNSSAGRLSFTADYAVGVPGAGVVIIAVGTPSLPSGAVDLTYVREAVTSLANLVDQGTTIVLKSTVPVGANGRMQQLFSEHAPGKDVSFASNPEFLKQGAAITDFSDPDRIVVGVTDERSEAVLREMYRPLIERGVPTVFTDVATSELTKYASNSFLAAKLSFINEMADLCDQTGASIEDVALGMGLDSRISPSYLNAGPGYGGSCFPKDTQALLQTGIESGSPSRIVAAAVEVNRTRRRAMVERIVGVLGGDVSGRSIGILGITFKANTDDLRESPAVEIAERLMERGAAVTIYDPQGMDNAARLLTNATFASDPYAALDGADAGVILTEWPEFGSLDLERVRSGLKTPRVIDLRNLYRVEVMAAAGIEYHSVGRPSSIPGS
ncbi:MAG: UDP-glucose/GDP-mannose dehydrogenase family protein [Armatimonadetes bacterium]|nr:MAG: UDP-glucose/GDP-mannose dehydrogenase family protein [Armatimonadota bacterium]